MDISIEDEDVGRLVIEVSLKLLNCTQLKIKEVFVFFMNKVGNVFFYKIVFQMNFYNQISRHW